MKETKPDDRIKEGDIVRLSNALPTDLLKTVIGRSRVWPERWVCEWIDENNIPQAMAFSETSLVKVKVRKDPAASRETVWVYRFSVALDSTTAHDRAVVELFKTLNTNVEMEMAEATFAQFRSNLAEHGLRLAEISRVPYHEPEPVL